MKRRQLFELSDLNSWPDAFRALLTGFLDLVGNIVHPFLPHSDLIAEALNAAQADTVTDFCSGAGSPWFYLLPEVEALCGRQISVELTDRFPRADGARKHDRISYRSTSVNVLLPTVDPPGLWSFFNCFHHFGPDDARKILQRAVLKGHPVAVFEMLQRSALDAFLALRIPILVLLLAPFIRPLRFQTLFFTYVLPIAPLAIAWDGIISVLRCYSPDELMSFTESLSGMRYVWKASAYRKGVVSVTYLIGYPIATTNISVDKRC